LEEYPIAKIPDTPTWSENFAFAGFDPKAGIEFFCHIGRWRRDVTLWREVVTVALPDGTVLVHRAIGNALATPTGPGGSNFSVQVVDPHKATFRLRFLGGVRRVSETELFEGPLLDGPHFRLSFDLAYDAAAPLWDISKVGDKSEFMGSGHVEQFGRLTGTIELEKERYEINTLANRDHSRGPRVFDSNIRHNWLQGYLDDGLMFQFYEAEVTGKVGPAYSEANVVVNGIAHSAKATIHDKLPFTENRHLSKAPVRFTLEYDGKVLDVTATDFVRTISIQSTSPNDMYVGRRQLDELQNTTVLEQGVLYKTPDGRKGFGHYERLVPGKLLVDPA
jgi:hypothetical protein